MNNLFSQPLFYIFLIYGASFLAMAYVVFQGVRKATSITLVTTYYALALFGLTHGITELIDWLRFVLKTTGNGEPALLTYLSQGFLIVSFVVLLQFGVELLTYRSAMRQVFRGIPSILFTVYLGGLLAARVTDVAKAGLIARHSFGFVGALLSGIAFYALANSMKAVVDSSVTKGLLATGAGFSVYAVVGGIIVQPLMGLPIQLFRAACAVTIAISSVYILGIFRVSEEEPQELEACEAAASKAI